MLVTVGHGTLDAGDFLGLLAGAGVTELVDVRSYPGSRRVPQFGRDTLRDWVPAGGVAYRWEPALGGRRRAPAGTSRNVALRNPAFRAYADHMATQPFADALTVVAASADRHVVAVMCAEAVWWRCHRRLIADAAVLVHGTPVAHLFHDGRLTDHRPSTEARLADIDGRRIPVYDVGTQQSLFPDDGEPPDSGR